LGQDDGKPAHEQIAAEHRSLDALFGDTRNVLKEADAGGEVRRAVTRLLEAVESHLSREESLYYPTLWALRPDLKPPLLRLVEAHDQFRSLLGAVAEAVESDALEDAAHRIDELVGLFNQHEVAEESLLDSLEEDLEASR
jgi:hemerythrin